MPIGAILKKSSFSWKPSENILLLRKHQPKMVPTPKSTKNRTSSSDPHRKQHTLQKCKSEQFWKNHLFAPNHQKLSQSEQNITQRWSRHPKLPKIGFQYLIIVGAQHTIQKCIIGPNFTKSFFFAPNHQKLSQSKGNITQIWYWHPKLSKIGFRHLIIVGTQHTIQK